jgi:glycosyltransferase involved in cell wall biosynthesis
VDFKKLAKATPKQLRAGLVHRLKSATNRERFAPLSVQPILTDAPLKLLIGPANFAGQGFAWARAAESAIPDLQAESLTRTVGEFGFPTDDVVTPYLYTTGRWKERQNSRILANFTHVLVEAGRPITGYLHGRNVDGEIGVFKAAGISCAVLSHGSDTRIPSNHLTKYPESPFNLAPTDVLLTLENRARTLNEIYSRLDVQVFLSTPDLLDDIPNGVWLPVVVDKAKWETQYATNNSKLKVLYAPSKSWIKGGPKVDEVLQSMSDRGQIEYQRVVSVPANDMPDLVKSADIVIDQFALGAYGAMAVQAMAAGKVVVGHVAPWVRDRIPGDVPIFDSTIEQLEEKVLELANDEALRRNLGLQGAQFVAKFHDGSYSGAVLKTWISPGV